MLCMYVIGFTSFSQLLLGIYLLIIFEHYHDHFMVSWTWKIPNVLQFFLNQRKIVSQPKYGNTVYIALIIIGSVFGFRKFHFSGFSVKNWPSLRKFDCQCQSKKSKHDNCRVWSVNGEVGSISLKPYSEQNVWNYLNKVKLKWKLKNGLQRVNAKGINRF